METSGTSETKQNSNNKLELNRSNGEIKQTQRRCARLCKQQRSISVESWRTCRMNKYVSCMRNWRLFFTSSFLLLPHALSLQKKIVDAVAQRHNAGKIKLGKRQNATTDAKQQRVWGQKEIPLTDCRKMKEKINELE